jgi:hypothetical protein
MCPNCQAPVREGADFCTNCGAQLGPAAASGSAPVTMQAPASAPPPGPATPPPYGAAPPGPGQVQRPSTPPFSFDLKHLGTTDLIIGGASIVAFISLFLPWFGFFSYTVSGLSAHGYLTIALLIDLALVGYLVLRAGWTTLPFRMPIAHAPLLLIATGVQLLFMLIGFLQSYGFSHEIGAYLGLLAALVAFGVIAAPAIRSLLEAQGGKS